MPREGPVPRSYSVFLIAILAGGGWFFTAGPGKGNFGKFVAQFTQQQPGQGQAGGYAPYGAAPQNYAVPGYAPPASSASYQTTSAPLPAQYASQSAPAGPAPPTPMFGGASIRVASFNIQVFGDAKASKP